MEYFRLGLMVQGGQGFQWALFGKLKAFPKCSTLWILKKKELDFLDSSFVHVDAEHK